MSFSVIAVSIETSETKSEKSNTAGYTFSGKSTQNPRILNPHSQSVFHCWLIEIRKFNYSQSAQRLRNNFSVRTETEKQFLSPHKDWKTTNKYKLQTEKQQTTQSIEQKPLTIQKVTLHKELKRANTQNKMKRHNAIHPIDSTNLTIK